MHVELPDGKSAELTEPGDLRDGDRKAVFRAVNLPQDGDVNGGILDSIYDVLLQRIVKGWSLPFPLPAEDPASLDKLTIAEGKALREAAKPHFNLVMGNEEDPTAESGS